MRRRKRRGEGDRRKGQEAEVQETGREEVEGERRWCGVEKGWGKNRR